MITFCKKAIFLLEFSEKFAGLYEMIKVKDMIRSRRIKIRIILFIFLILEQGRRRRGCNLFMKILRINQCGIG